MSVKELSDNIDVDLSTLHIMDEEAEEIDMETEATDNVDSNATKNLENANITIASMFIENERDMEHENTDEGIILNEDWANPEEIFDFYVMSAEQLEMANQWVIGGF